MAGKVALGLVVAGGIAVGLAWGLRAFLVYAFLAGIAGAVSLGLSVGGEWLTGASRGRFDRGPRRRG